MAGKSRPVEQTWESSEANEGGFWFQRESSGGRKRQSFSSTQVWGGQQILFCATWYRFSCIFIFFRAAVEKLHCVDDAFRRQLESLQASHQAELLRLANDKQKQIEQANVKVLVIWLVYSVFSYLSLRTAAACRVFYRVLFAPTENFLNLKLNRLSCVYINLLNKGNWCVFIALLNQFKHQQIAFLSDFYHRCSRWRRKCASCLRKLRVIKG